MWNWNHDLISKWDNNVFFHQRLLDPCEIYIYVAKNFQEKEINVFFTIFCIFWYTWQNILFEYIFHQYANITKLNSTQNITRIMQNKIGSVQNQFWIKFLPSDLVVLQIYLKRYAMKQHVCNVSLHKISW